MPKVITDIKLLKALQPILEWLETEYSYYIDWVSKFASENSYWEIITYDEKYKTLTYDEMNSFVADLWIWEMYANLIILFLYNS